MAGSRTTTLLLRTVVDDRVTHLLNTFQILVPNGPLLACRQVHLETDRVGGNTQISVPVVADAVVASNSCDGRAGGLPVRLWGSFLSRYFRHVFGSLSSHDFQSLGGLGLQAGDGPFC